MNTGNDDFRPSDSELRRLSEVEVRHTEDGVDVIDNSLERWEPTDQQQIFLEHLLDDEECKVSLYHAMRAADGTMRDLNRWCRQQPQFLALLRDQVQERFSLAEIGADLVVIGAAGGSVNPTRDEKWGVEALLKIKDFLHKKEMRFIQINQQFNIGVNMDMDDEALMKVISENTSQDTAAAEIIDG